MSLKCEITKIEDIQLLVDSFYSAVRENELLGPIFNRIIQDRWPAHLEKMYRFWQTVLLEEHTYNGSPFPPHAGLPVNKQHFDTWLSIWHQTIDEHFEGAIADEAKWRGVKMAGMFLSKIEYYSTTGGRPLV
ncbi:group III truncated hemoglobin [Chitinophaga polysaccharea]|uniref:group III truncated hemoglobin n=1 Tax=Chitinophaga TaxID=79328 RepID=UPI00145554E6|nr:MULTISPECIES: group III truncated hemoglobin [Chitinophaga]NLR57497.1 group III truncated hemoglobin [Chitinophaga polysaccharea]NLU95411.1 group III truncated hemoglobin [Chitinophaga sp. Ak27]